MNLTRGLILLAFTISLLGLQERDNPGKKTLIESLQTDSLRYDMYLLENELGESEGYMAEIFTPVCHTNECYPVYIDFYWDLLGNYLKYEIPEGELLTKLDHVPFDDEDHEKLQEILSNERSLLKDYKIEELVGSTQTVAANGVDAVTGATLKTIKNEVIDGAVYSCYTLWHLAHGEMAEKVKVHTEGLYSKALLIQFLESGHYPYQYWAIEKVINKDLYTDDKLSTAMLEVLLGDNIFLSSHLIKVLPEEVFSSLKRQVWLWQTMEKSPYKLQMKMLDKFNTLKLYPELQIKLLEGLKEGNPAQQRKVYSVLKNQLNLSKSLQYQVLDYIKQGIWKDGLIELLLGQNKLDKKIKKQLNTK
ncbi:hypothetical protein [Cyclobacterium marinum]|uniref:Uncharacterized protein n=1 Tax=Cyclobacterium marinum (strain ATCC 25205 / DSM 745 / LMG 13164 / NCIMB 1802) TaxID=880070 RepID=G0J4A7_CYCMS|nr:hypothetical protein [Cyclobacterium marinum]AEL27533.1 hypothetical protein Cycma_3822 [Cyclobacterium marinum DSM 745]MBR9776374.1 hypothetical protein [Cytophagales bacterium]|tara:strand:- start:65910 stop:66992 length:1083 start_codon:yes stop_codon:yes gene_type:complete